MKRKSSKTGVLIFAIICLVAVSGAYWYFYTIVHRHVDSTTAALTDIVNEQFRRAHAEALTSIFKSTADGRAKLTSFFVMDDQLVHFIEKLEGMGAGTGAEVTITSIAADNLSSAESGAVGTVKAHVDGTGSWSSVMKVLLTAENLPYSVKINNLRLSSAGKGKWGIGFELEALSLK